MSVTCLNCNTVYEGKDCPECGQKAKTERVTFSSILHDIPHSIFHVDKGVFYTLVQLLYRPGKAVKEYLAGRRVNYFLPFAYLFLLSGITAFITHQKLDYLLSQGKVATFTNSYIPYLPAAILYNKYPALLFCTLIPLISLFSWLLNLDSKYNYWENIILNTYLIAQFNLFFAINDIIISIHYYGSLTPMLVCFFCYIGFAYYQFFPGKSAFIDILKKIVLFGVIVVMVLTSLTFSGLMTRWWW